MAEPADQAPGISAPPNDPLAPRPEEAAVKQGANATDRDNQWADVLNAMREAEQAVSDAVQGMADPQIPSNNNHK